MALLREITLRYQFIQVDCDITGNVIDSPHRIARIFSDLKYETKEKFIVVTLNTRHEIMNYEVVAIGDVASIQVRPIELFRTAIILNAPAIVAIHNHPSGSLEPSAADKCFTKRLARIGRDLDVRLLDHMIVSSKGHNSLRETESKLFYPE
ncbi:JAB domain-containing protein [uncultured Microbulbifer sp.]|uniref:JAB domain-containing protein n=1 Tax=uncultured Microbulbifer sp. TaxID=348147 RepID=UPI002632E754|nr:JAB domain-containing protein [uncultured Microbulbifer sp.]